MKKLEKTKPVGILIEELHSGGVQKIALNQVITLKKLGVDSKLLVLRRTDIKGHPFSDLIKRVEIVYLDDRLPDILRFSFKFPHFSFFSLYQLTYPLFIPFVLNKEEFQVIVSHGTYTSFTALALRFTKGVPFFVSLWDPISYILKKAYTTGPINALKFVLLPIAQLVDWLILNSAHGVIVAGEAHIQYVKDLGVKNIAKIYPGVNPNSKISKDRDNYIITATAWKETKKPEYNLEILSTLGGVKMVMAGNWYPIELQTEFEKRVKERNLADRVSITGPLEEEKLNKYYQQALVFLQTNDDRGFGMPALEAAAQGCTFVIPEGQGVGELFEDKEDGFFTKERDTRQILAKLDLLFKDKRKAVEMGRSAWEKVKSNYSWEKHAQNLIDFIKQK